MNVEEAAANLQAILHLVIRGVNTLKGIQPFNNSRRKPPTWGLVRSVFALFLSPIDLVAKRVLEKTNIDGIKRRVSSNFLFED